MRKLDRKVLRDLWEMKGQALAIAFVIASGVATFVMALATLQSLTHTQASFYERTEFASVFASAKRVPEGVAARIAEIPGVARIQTRVVGAANLEIDGFADPVTARLISLPDAGLPLLNRIYLRAGRMVDPAAEGEIVLSEAFALAHGLEPGDTLHAVVNGRRRAFAIAGIGLSPESIYLIAPGTFIPDFLRHAHVWMARTPLAAAFDMEGAFNDVALTLAAGAEEREVMARVDDVLAPYGGAGAYPRADQVSHRYLSEEFRQLRQMAILFPMIFLGVAAFLLNVVVARLVATQREQIGILKAFGYEGTVIGVHYLKLVLVIVLVGAVVGVGFGAWLGRGMSNMYLKFYKFPAIEFVLSAPVILSACFVSIAAGASGTLFALRRAMKLPPAEAMRPEAPPRYRESIVERLGFQRFLSQPARMIIRRLERTPVKSIFSVLGVAASVAILVLGMFFNDAVDEMLDVQFGLAQREDLAITFTEPTSRGALFELRAMPGVVVVEPFRSVPVRLRAGHRTYRTSLQGFEPDADLERLLDPEFRPLVLPPDGLLLTAHLGGILGVGEGDRLTVEVLDGARPVYEVTIARLVEQFVGVGAYMSLDALSRLLGEGGAVSGAFLAVDEKAEGEIYARLREMPRVAGVTAQKSSLKNLLDTMAQQLLTFAFFNTLLAASIAFGVVYNSARIALAERARELASLRVLGFTRGEISSILLGELAALVLAAIPTGFVLGRGLCEFLARRMQTDLFRFPVVVYGGTYAFAATVVLVAACLSAFIVRRQLHRLDLVAVLKTKE